ncbi:hypothetical protein B0H10DRAFT_216747 [Mycena sp. CBHHK59/15]|nr:hypothetical protein B0H10DRAFT_216747 [Mycena sp. CBHHK59/15]
MATRQITPPSASPILAPTNTLKRALSEDADSDSVPDPKKIKLLSENTPQSKDRKKRKKKKKKTPVVVPLELPSGSTNAAPASSVSLVLSPTLPSRKNSINSGKGKQKAASSPPPLPPQLQDVTGVQQSEVVKDIPQTSVTAESLTVIIARLNQELGAQSILLKKHEDTLSQLHQSLTCQVCLDLLHKPYALAPCGHIACYDCLVSWFTSEPEEHYMGSRKKTCPHCRAIIKERPVEVWSIKDMVAGLLKSSLVSGLSTGPPPPPALPGPPQRADAAHPPDPWHNIFRHSHQHPRFHPPVLDGQPVSVEDMGMFDAEDGGVYRCLDCMHEIWDGVCTNCHRIYQGHNVDHDLEEGEMFDDSGDDDDDVVWPPFPNLVAALAHQYPPGHWWGDFGDDDDDDDDSVGGAEGHGAHDAEDGYDSFIDDDEEDGGLHPAANIIEINSDSEHGSSPPPRATHDRRAAPVNRRHNRIVLSDSENEDDDVGDVGPSRSRRGGNRAVSSPPIEPIDVSDDDNDDDTPRR